MKGKKPLLGNCSCVALPPTIRIGVLKLLLIAIMVLQPLVGAYAMTAMDHNQGSLASQAMYDHEMDHGGIRQATNEDDSSIPVEDCCASNAACLMAACNAALLMDSFSVLKIEITSVVPAYQLSWAGILLPTEIRPPRSPLG